MLGFFGLGYRKPSLNRQDRHQKLHTKKASADRQRRCWRLDYLIVQLDETALNHIASIMRARASAVLTAFRFSPMRDFRCNQSRRLQSAVLGRRQPKGQQDNCDDMAERIHYLYQTTLCIFCQSQPSISHLSAACCAANVTTSWHRCVDCGQRNQRNEKS